MGEWTARGVLGSDDYGDMYKNVSANKQAQMNNLLQARQIAASGRNAAYGAAAQMAAQNNTADAFNLINQANQYYNAERDASREFVAPGTQFTRADNTKGFSGIASPTQDDPTYTRAQEVQQHAARLNQGYGMDDKSMNPEHPNYQYRQAIDLYRNETDPVKKSFALSSLQAYSDPETFSNPRMFAEDPNDTSANPSFLKNIWNSITGKTP